MESTIIVLTFALLFMIVVQIATVYIFLKHLGVAPKLTMPVRVVKNEDTNDFGENKYVDISEITPEEGLQALRNK